MELLLITSCYPFNCGDTAFINQEMPFLTKMFDKVHVLPTSYNDIEDELKKTIAVPNNVIMLPSPTTTTNSSNQKRGGLKSVCSSFPMFIFSSSLLLSEIFFMLRRKKLNKKTLKDAVNFLFDAVVTADSIYRHLLANKEIKLVYTYWYTYHTMSILICKKYYNKKTKCITRTHGFDSYEFRTKNNYHPFKSWMDKNIDRVYFASDALKDYYLSNYRIPKNAKYIVSKLGTVNSYSIPAAGMNSSSNKVINIASCSFIVPGKRIHLIIEALSKIDSINIHWTHIGDGSEREYIESLANNLLGGKKNIIYQFIGFLDNESVKKVYNENHFDYFISTTESEGLPVSMMEAISFGIPVIATAVGGVPEIVTEKTGVLLNPDNCVEELVSALYHLNNMANCEKQALRESCRRYWENNFMADRQYAKFIDGLKELLYKD